MPHGFSLPSSDVESIVGVQFSIFSPEEIEKRSVVEVVSKDTYVGNEPKIGGLFDPRMGVLDNGKICRSCGQTNHKCPGHFGHYRLARPVYFFQFFQYIKNILRCVCISCGKLLIDKELHKDLLKKSGEARWKEVYNLCSNIDRCGQEAADGCGAPQPTKFMKEGIARIVALFNPDAVTTQNALAITTGQTAVPTTQTSAGQKLSAMELEVEFVHRLFRRISDEDVDFMGFSRYWCRPDWMICTVLPIPPPQVRPSVVQDNNQRSEDDLTHKLHDIIKHDQYLAQKIAANAKKEIVDELISVVQYHVATLVDNQIPGVSLAAQRSGRPLKSIQQRIGAKEGRIRYNIQGKRVEFSARSVITGDPNLSIQELGVPLEIATNLSIPEKVTQWNRDKLYKLVQNGPNKWPGAKTIVRADGRMISLKHVNTNEIVLYNGDTVNRHLMDNDIVLFNRQPTLHKMSMMGHRAKILPYKTFRLNVQVVKPYNADFDGDEMNAHISQSEKAQVELQEIAAVPHQIITPRHAKPVIGVVQDALVGSYRITRPGITFNRREFMNLMMYNRRFDGTLPTPKAGNGRWTGQQVMSQLLPPINMAMGNKSFDEKDSKESPNFVKIHQGEITQGTLDDDIFGKAGKGIVHVAYNDYGSKQTVEMLDAIQSTVESFLVLNGFSVGISDLVADAMTKSEVEKVIQNQKKAVEQIILQVHLGLFDNNTGKTNQQEFEDQMFAILNEATKSAGKLAQNSLSVENRLISMIKAGSKGSTTNIAQMVACLGQQAIEGKRITYGFTDRTLPHYKKYDDSAEARGFVESSFIRGLSPQEFFFHAMGGREGLIDTAVKTAETGYIQRQLIKGLEDLVTQHDGTVRDSNGNIVQFHYGEDGTSATRIENQSLPLAKMSHSEIRRQFTLEGVDWASITPDSTTPPIDSTALAQLVDLVIEDQRMLVEGIGRGNGLDAGSVQAPVNLVRTITTIKTQFGIRSEDKTDLQPNYVLTGIKNIIQKTMPFNRIWAALLRFYLSPHNIIVKERFTMRAFDSLVELLVLKNMRSWAQPGEQVGIVAAQSIGEPSTQMSVIGSTVIYITDGAGENFHGTIENFVDTMMTKNTDKVVDLGNNSKIYKPEKDYYIVGVSDTEKTSWQKISEVSRHPANGGLVRITTRSGRKTTATLSHSFLTRSTTGVVPILGSELHIGMRVPVARCINSPPNALKELEVDGTIFQLTRDFGWLCGIYLADGSLNGNTTCISKIHPTVEDIIRKTVEKYSYEVTVREFNGEYGPSKSIIIYSSTLKKFLNENFSTGSYNKHIGENIMFANNDFVAGLLSGYFDGDGNVNSERQQIRAGSRSKILIKDLSKLLARQGVFTIIGQEQSARIPGKVMYTLQILKQNAEQFAENIGFQLYEKAVALNEIIKYNNRSNKHDSKELIDKIPMLGEVIAETGRLLKMPGQSRIYGRWSNKESIGRRTLKNYIKDFSEMATNFPIKDMVEAAKLTENIAKLSQAIDADVIWDEIIDLEILEDSKEYVYDFTVPGNDSFLVDENILVHNTLNTFHLAGVASKSNVTRGVPRLRELLKVTKNPKATSLTITMKPEYRTSKERAREVQQDLELTILRNITEKVAIYWEPSEDTTVLEEDKDLLHFARLVDDVLSGKTANLDGQQGASELKEPEKTPESKWVLRLELNKEVMFNKNISIQEVVFAIQNSFQGVEVIYSDYNADKLVLRIRIDTKENKKSMGYSKTASNLDDYINLKKFKNRLLTQLVIRGIPGIKAVTFRKDNQKVELRNVETGETDKKYQDIEQYILDTDGSNFIRVMNHPLVDGTKLYSTNVHDIYEVLGVEATREALMSEINVLFNEVGVNYRHLGLLTDVMTRNGRLMSIDRYGINKSNIGPLAKMSFEETESIVQRASIFGEIDPVMGVSANIMMGQTIRGGTAFSQILLDEQALMRLREGLPPVETEGDAGEEQNGDISDLLDQANIVIDPCATNQFQVHLQVPQAQAVLDEPDVDIEVM